MTTVNVDSGEVERFAELARRWWDPQGPLGTLHAINPLRLRYVTERCELAGARALDVGCGAGLFSEAMARAGATVTALDLAAVSIDVAREHATASGLEIDYRVADVESVAASAAGDFDVVTCLEVLEHVPDPGSVIRACAQAARPGGSVFFSTINRNTKSFLLAIVGAEYLLGLLPRGTHEYMKLIQPAELAAAVREAGLDLRELTGLHYNPVTQRYWLGGNVDVNYFAYATRAPDD